MNKEKEQDNIQAANKEQQEKDNIQVVNEDEQEQDNIHVVNKEEHEEQEQNEGCSGITEKRRQFTLQVYLWVIHQKVDTGFSLQEASKSINISNKQILEWKEQAATMTNRNNQQAKSLGDGVTSFLSPYTDNLLSFIFEMREAGMAVSVNSIILKASQLSREFRKRLTQQGTPPRLNSSMCMVSCIRWGHTYLNVNPLKRKRLLLILYVSLIRNYK